MQRDNIWNDAVAHLSSTDELLAGLIAKYGPCRLGPGGDYFTVLCKSIISQQLATKAAAAIFDRFSAHYENAPTPDAIAATSREVLRDLGLSNQKVNYISDLASKVLDGHVSLQDFPSLPDAEIIRQLVEVKGIGVWTTQMFLIFALNRPDVLPTDDFGIRRAIMAGYHLESMPGKAEMETIAAPWCPWRSIACWYLWRSLENT